MLPDACQGFCRHSRLFEIQPGVFIEARVAQSGEHARKRVLQRDKPGVIDRVGMNFHTRQDARMRSCKKMVRQEPGADRGPASWLSEPVQAQTLAWSREGVFSGAKLACSRMIASALAASASSTA